MKKHEGLHGDTKMQAVLSDLGRQTHKCATPNS